MRFILLFVLLFCLIPTQAQENTDRLARGINLPFWFWYGPENEAAIENYFTDADFALIHNLGFTFVRVPITLEFLLDEGSSNYLNEANVQLLDNALQKILAHDLAVIVDLHSTSLNVAKYPNIFSGRLETEDWFYSIYEQFWRSFAKHLSDYDPEMLFIEPMNEPVFENRTEDWPPMQEQLIAAIRENAPEHTIIATGAMWSNLDTLTALEPLDDPNIVYNFHFYEPFWFTHQGATWAGDEAMRMRNVPYPSSPELVASILPTLDEDLQEIIRQYGEETWNIERIEARIQKAAAWAEQHGVRLLCDEFGAYSRYTLPGQRVQWIHDVRTTFEKYDIGWSMWEYHDTFGLVRREHGEIIVDEAVATALGLNVE